MSPTLPSTVRVQALPWPIVELLSGALRKLAHDLTNSMVAGVSMIDLLAMRNTDPLMAEPLQRLRGHVLRPRGMLRVAVAVVPAGADRSRSWTALRTDLLSAAASQQVMLRWQAPVDGPPPGQALSESDWCHIVEALCHNALDAHAAARLDRDPGAGLGQITVTWREAPTQQLQVLDNGPGCANLVGAAKAEVRRAGGGHMGLGLAVVAALAERAGGSLTISSVPDLGFTATVDVPGRH